MKMTTRLSATGYPDDPLGVGRALGFASRPYDRFALFEDGGRLSERKLLAARLVLAEMWKT